MRRNAHISSLKEVIPGKRLETVTEHYEKGKLQGKSTKCGIDLVKVEVKGAMSQLDCVESAFIYPFYQ